MTFLVDTVTLDCTIPPRHPAHPFFEFPSAKAWLALGRPSWWTTIILDLDILLHLRHRRGFGVYLSDAYYSIPSWTGHATTSTLPRLGQFFCRMSSWTGCFTTNLPCFLPHKACSQPSLTPTGVAHAC
jgi:hypothetical protein